MSRPTRRRSSAAMPARRHTGPSTPMAWAPRRADFPRLTAFLRGYLHEEAFESYASPLEACRAFRAEADAAEREAFDAERALLGARLASVTLAEARAALAALGSAWHPRTRAELEELFGR
jgi:hypothetical protein